MLKESERPLSLVKDGGLKLIFFFILLQKPMKTKIRKVFKRHKRIKRKEKMIKATGD